MRYGFATIDELGEGYGFRKVRQPLGVTAFGVNAIVYPPGFEGFHHYHDQQDELYFVHCGTARFEVDGEERLLGPGGLCHVDLDDAAQGLERRRGRPRRCSSSAERTATSSGTGTSSTRPTPSAARRAAFGKSRLERPPELRRRGARRRCATASCAPLDVVEPGLPAGADPRLVPEQEPDHHVDLRVAPSFVQACCM